MDSNMIYAKSDCIVYKRVRLTPEYCARKIGMFDADKYYDVVAENDKIMTVLKNNENIEGYNTYDRYSIGHPRDSRAVADEYFPCVLTLNRDMVNAARIVLNGYEREYFACSYRTMFEQYVDGNSKESPAEKNKAIDKKIRFYFKQFAAKLDMICRFRDKDRDSSLIRFEIATEEFPAVALRQNKLIKVNPQFARDNGIEDKDKYMVIRENKDCYLAVIGRTERVIPKAESREFPIVDKAFLNWCELEILSQAMADFNINESTLTEDDKRCLRLLGEKLRYEFNMGGYLDRKVGTDFLAYEHSGIDTWKQRGAAALGDTWAGFHINKGYIPIIRTFKDALNRHPKKEVGKEEYKNIYGY